MRTDNVCHLRCEKNAGLQEKLAEWFEVGGCANFPDSLTDVRALVRNKVFITKCKDLKEYMVIPVFDTRLKPI